MINEYKTVIANNPEDLDKSISNFLNQGYRCQGGVSYDAVNNMFMQAMVRKKPDSKKA